MKPNLDPSAIENYNSKAESLLLKLSPQPANEIPKNKIFETDVVTKVISEEDIIGELKLGRVDHQGKNSAKYFEIDGKWVGLYNENYKQLTKICEGIRQSGSLADVVGQNFLEDKIFEWMEKRYKGLTTLKMWDCVCVGFENEVKEFEIWIPVAMTQIESSFKIGNVTFKTLTKEIIDKSYLEAISEKETKQIEELNLHFDSLRRDYQGYPVAVIKLVAEKQRAFERAFDEIDVAISLLRFFSPACFYPQAISYTQVKGKENVGIKNCFICDNERIIFQHSETENDPYIWKLDSEQLNEIFKIGLETLSALLLKTGKNDFQERILNSLYLYSRSALTKNLTDKLTYILVSLESILLKNDTEPIQQNIGDRLAFAISKKGSERRTIVQNVKEVYGLRSKFLHHGYLIKDVEAIQTFMFNAWTFLHLLILNSNNFRSKEMMIDSLDELKYSGK